MTEPPSPLRMLLSRHTKRREFVASVIVTAAAWPFGARAQQSGRTYRLGLLTNGPVVGPLDERRKTMLSGLAGRGFSYPAALAAKTSTKDIPIVVAGAGDPVATGLVDGLARPGGNITGVTELSTELSAKRLEILRDALPGLSRVAMLWNAADLGMTLATAPPRTPPACWASKCRPWACASPTISSMPSPR
jgi:ABC transporter substrate binding protein